MKGHKSAGEKKIIAGFLRSFKTASPFYEQVKFWSVPVVSLLAHINSSPEVLALAASGQHKANLHGRLTTCEDGLGWWMVPAEMLLGGSQRGAQQEWIGSGLETSTLLVLLG